MKGGHELITQKIRAHSPFALFESSLFSLKGDDRFPKAAGALPQCLVPRIDVTERAAPFEVSADLPGMKLADIDWILGDGVLSVVPKGN